MSQTNPIKHYTIKHFTYRRYKQTRFWAVQDENGELVAVTVYKKGAEAVAQRLTVDYGYSLTEAGRQALAEVQETGQQ